MIVIFAKATGSSKLMCEKKNVALKVLSMFSSVTDYGSSC